MRPKLYGIAIILYAIVPVIRLTDLGIRLVDKDVIEAAEAFGMTRHQKFVRVQIPLDNAGMARAVRGETRGAYERDARDWLERVGLGGQEGQYPHQLSGGMQQRVGIARALASNAPIMLMDEAFSALDPLIRTDMQDLLLELQQELQKTIVFISHDLDKALKLADHLVILKDGIVVQQGEPQEILLNPDDPYIVDFISDINRARVLRVRSVMDVEPASPPVVAGEVDADATLESVIALSGGDTALSYEVLHDGVPVGYLNMQKLVRALVPTQAARNGMRKPSRVEPDCSAVR